MLKRKEIWIIVIGVGLLVGFSFGLNALNKELDKEVAPFIQLEEEESGWIIYDISLDPKTEQFRLEYRNLPPGEFFLPPRRADERSVKIDESSGLITVALGALTEIPKSEGKLEIDNLLSLKKDHYPYFLYQSVKGKEWRKIHLPSIFNLNILHTGRVIMTIYREI